MQCLLTDLCYNISGTTKYKLKILEGKRKEFRGRSMNEVKDVYMGSIQAGRKNDCAECHSG